MLTPFETLQADLNAALTKIDLLTRALAAHDDRLAAVETRRERSKAFLLQVELRLAKLEHLLRWFI